MSIFSNLFNSETKKLNSYRKLADEADSYKEKFSKLSDDELKNKTKEFKNMLENGRTLDSILPEAFAVVREASTRVLGQTPFYTQLLGGIAIHFGNIAEMKTGEGKTLTCVMPAYLNALTGKGVHIITVNEYLADRDANWMGEIFRFLGLTVGINRRDLTASEKKDVYNCDIVYSTNNEIGFDYLRDNMVVRKKDKVQRELNFAIIDEVDSVLIDEARTPLIISGGRIKLQNLYMDADKFVKKLKENEDYTIDEKTKSIKLTDDGAKKCEKTFKIDNLYDIANSALVHHVNNALIANYTKHKDVDYVVQDGEIVIVDQFTGRLMKGRAYSEGIHQAIEAKENVKIQDETRTLATITFQNLFRMYSKLSGMTGTAKTEEEEFRNIYNMYVIEIPTNKPVIREDYPDLIYAVKKDKYEAIVNEVIERHKAGQPVLVGTIAIETSEILSDLLKKKGIKHEVLNAKNHAREAEIIANAGEKGAVTIATNMAGRGTDIKLGKGVKELGGLSIIGTERHESRRIDNQLRGRAGRQGDPGCSQFFVSFEDDIMVRFGTDRFKTLLQMAGVTAEKRIKSKTLTKSVENAQKRIEGNNFDIRKNVLKYDNVMSQHRKEIYNKRNLMIDGEKIHEEVLENFKDLIYNQVNNHLEPEGYLTEKDISEIKEYINTNLLKNNSCEITETETDKVIEEIQKQVIISYEEKIKELPEEIIKDFERTICLQIIDTHWMEHINTMEHLRQGIGLRGYANEDPLQAYIKEGTELFYSLLDKISQDISIYLLKAEIRQNLAPKEVAKPAKTNDTKDMKAPSKKTEKIGRNSLCPCGSGKKYKQCCGK